MFTPLKPHALSLCPGCVSPATGEVSGASDEVLIAVVTVGFSVFFFISE